MNRLNRYITQYIQSLVTHPRSAVFVAILFALLPYTDWLSMGLIALVTLRKGWRDGLMLLVPVMVAHLVYSVLSIPVVTAVINTILTFLPCYVVAYTLRLTVSWRAVAGVLFLHILLASVLIQLFVPKFILAQAVYVKHIISSTRPDHTIMTYLNHASDAKQVVFANYLFGMQMLIIAMSALMALMLARSVQARLYNPGGFRQEVLSFRDNKIGLLVFGLVAMAAMNHYAVAMNLLPACVFYFLLAGLSLSANALIKKNVHIVTLILIAPLLLLPFVMLPVYVVLGSLDSLFNLRVYFAQKSL